MSAADQRTYEYPAVVRVIVEDGEIVHSYLVVSYAADPTFPTCWNTQTGEAADPDPTDWALIEKADPMPEAE